MFRKHFLYREANGGGGGGGSSSSAGSAGSSGGSGGASGDSTDYKALYAQAQATLQSSLQEATQRYTGLQTTLNKEKEAHEGTKGALAAATTKLTGFETSVAELTGKFDSLSKDHLAKLDELTKAQAELARVNLLVTDFIDLAPFAKDGLLPTADTIDDLKKKYEAFRVKLGEHQEAAEKKHAAGGTPGQPAGKGEQSAASKADQLLKDATNALLVEHDQAKYDRIYQEYLTEKGKAASPSK